MKSQQLFLLLIFFKQILAHSDDFYQWVQNVQNPSFNCPNEDLEPLEGVEPFVQVVNCDEENSTFRYDFKVSFCSQTKTDVIKTVFQSR